MDHATDQTTRTPSDPRVTSLSEFFEKRADGSDDPADDLGDRIAEARTAAGMTQRDLAGRLGVREATIVKWENGESAPGGKRLTTTAGVLGVGLSWLMVGHGDEPIERDDPVHDAKNAIADVRGRLTDALDDLARLDERITEISD